jgi:hypothetical protein
MVGRCLAIKLVSGGIREAAAASSEKLREPIEFAARSRL